MTCFSLSHGTGLPPVAVSRSKRLRAGPRDGNGLSVAQGQLHASISSGLDPRDEIERYPVGFMHLHARQIRQGVDKIAKFFARMQPLIPIVDKNVMFVSLDQAHLMRRNCLSADEQQWRRALHSVRGRFGSDGSGLSVALVPVGGLDPRQDRSSIKNFEAEMDHITSQEHPQDRVGRCYAQAMHLPEIPDPEHLVHDHGGEGARRHENRETAAGSTGHKREEQHDREYTDQKHQPVRNIGNEQLKWCQIEPI